MIYHELANATGIPVYLAYTHHGTPTTTYKLFTPGDKKAVKHKHHQDTLVDLETFMYTLHERGMVFFARMERYPVHIDPWMDNSAKCFTAKDVRNTKRASFPGSKLGDCLRIAVERELQRHEVKGKHAIVAALDFTMYNS